VDGTGCGSCPVPNFVISDVEYSCTVIREWLILIYRKFHLM
jgi:hypothetical protein